MADQELTTPAQAMAIAAPGLPGNWPAMNPEIRDIFSLRPYPRNARVHSDAQVAEIAASMLEFGWTYSILVDEQDEIIAGHGRLEAGIKIGFLQCPVIVARGWSDAQKRAYRLADNAIPLNATWDAKLVGFELAALGKMDFNLDLIGFGNVQLNTFVSGLGDGRPAGEAQQTLAERFGIVPFSVLNAREGFWQTRKAAWAQLGIQSELGRGATANDRAASGSARINDAADARRGYATPGGSAMPAADYSQRARGDGRGRAIEKES